MNIKSIEAYPISIPQRSYRDAYTTFTSSRAVITKIVTDKGIVGYGESSALTPEIYGENLGSITSTIKTIFAPALIGKNPFDTESINAIMDRLAGVAPCAKTGIDLAVFDILGKELNQPVYNLLGGKFFDKVYVAFEIGISNPEEMVKEARHWVEKGLKVVKIKAGSGDIAKDIERIRAVTDALGNDLAYRVDPNAHWTVSDCKKAHAAVLKNVNLDYLEQPLPRWDLDGMREVRETTNMALEADEAAWTINDVMEICKRRAADVINLKIPKVGGLLKGKKMAAIAESAGLSCMSGAEGEVGSAIGAKLHLAASTPNSSKASDFTELALLTEWLLKEPIEMTRSGYLEVPTKPGLGVEPDEAKMKRWVVNI